MRIDTEMLDELTCKAQDSPRLRMNFDLRNSETDLSQRMLNAIEPGSVIPIHRHKRASETVVLVRGKAVEVFYDESGHIIESIELSSEGRCFAVNIPKGQWHTIYSHESGTVIFEVKNGAFEPMQPDDIMNQ